jgi:hypothetical protein
MKFKLNLTNFNFEIINNSLKLLLKLKLDTPNLEVVTVATKDKKYEGYKWGHAWVNYKYTSKTGEVSKMLSFVAYAIKDGKLQWQQAIYDSK